MYPIVGRFGPFIFYSYTLLMGIGLMGMVALAAWQAQGAARAPRAAWVDALLISLPAALAGGRLVYVAAHPAYFEAHPGEVWLLARGGLSYHGALLTGLLALGLWCAWRGVSFVATAGLLAPGAALWSAAGWLACWLEGCASGRETFLGPLAASLPDSYGLYAVRFQTQLLGFILSILAFAVLWRWRRLLAPGTLFLLAVVLLSIGRFTVNWLRGDPMPMVGNVRLDVVIDGATAATALLLLIIRNEGVNESRETTGRLSIRP